jgi:hypothetical protein
MKLAFGLMLLAQPTTARSAQHMRLAKCRCIQDKAVWSSGLCTLRFCEKQLPAERASPGRVCSNKLQHLAYCGFRLSHKLLVVYQQHAGRGKVRTAGQSAKAYSNHISWMSGLKLSQRRELPWHQICVEKHCMSTRTCMHDLQARFVITSRCWLVHYKLLVI